MDITQKMHWNWFLQVNVISTVKFVKLMTNVAVETILNIKEFKAYDLK